MKRVFLSISLLLFILLLCNFFIIENMFNVYAESAMETQQVDEESLGDGEELERTLQNSYISDAEAVKKDKECLEIEYASGDNAHDIKHDINLRTSGYYGTTISWSSDKPSLIGTNGKVTILNDPSISQMVILTATINKGYEFDTKQFRLWVSETSLSDEEAVAQDTKNIELGFAPGDCDSNVTQNIKLPRQGKYGSEIAWQSTKPEVLKDDGRVIRPGYLREDAFV